VDGSAEETGSSPPGLYASSGRKEQPGIFVDTAQSGAQAGLVTKSVPLHTIPPPHGPCSLVLFGLWTLEAGEGKPFHAAVFFNVMT
jgi:hypothetical protein